MPNIFLRLPTSRCQYFRHRDPKQVLAWEEPLIFNAYMPEYFVMKNSLTNASSRTQQVNPACFSQWQWTNMMQGKHPLGGKVIVKRNTADYLTFAEVQYLNGILDYDRSIKEDYLCIHLPSEVEMIDMVRPVTPTYTLEVHGVRRLLTMLNNDFKRSLVDWAISTFDFCVCNGRIIARAQTAMLERYLMRYGIEPTTEEKDNLRRIILRWLKTDHLDYTSYSCMDMQYEDPKESIHRVDGIVWL